MKSSSSVGRLRQHRLGDALIVEDVAGELLARPHEDVALGLAPSHGCRPRQISVSVFKALSSRTAIFGSDPAAERDAGEVDALADSARRFRSR